MEGLIMEKFDSYNDKKFPVCKFGPGGEYCEDWPMGAVSVSDPLGKVLGVIAKIIGAVTNELTAGENEFENELVLQDAGHILNMEDEFGTDMSDASVAATNAVAAADRKLAQEPMLFDNHTGTGHVAGHKSNNRVRARRGAKRKRAPFGTMWQGSLFEHYGQSTQVA
jgi:hypothetical protein